MIVVTGTMRSGTSMWMQLLIAAGLPHLGEAFPLAWGESLRHLNPRGFYESQLVSGIYHATNPHPETGDYLFPEQTRRHVVKVFASGLVRTDVAFLDRVVATVRPFREFCASVDRMGEATGARGEGPGGPTWLRWWVGNFGIIRNAAVRRFPVHVSTYGRMVRDPGREVAAVLDWIGEGNAAAATAAVDPDLRTVDGAPTPDGVSRHHAAVFDELYDHLDRGRDLPAAFVERLNQTDRELQPLLLSTFARAVGPTRSPA